MKCDSCAATRKGDRAGGGWKRHQGREWCPDCWRKHYMLRAVTIPVAGPVDCDWPTLRETMKHCWANATALANWATSELYKNDAVRTPNMEKLPKYPGKLYLYPEARKVVPEMDPTSITSLLRSIERKYGARRFAVIWSRSESLPSHRYPVPYPVHNQAWSASIDDGGATLLAVRLGGERRTLRLRGGPEFRRQLRAVRRLIGGEAVACELALYEAKVSTNANRVGGEAREAGGGERHSTRLMAKMVLWLPKSDRDRQRDGIMYLSTSGSTFWHYRIGEEGQTSTLHADHLKRAETISRAVVGHRNRIDKISDDQKYHRRATKRMRHWTNERRAAWSRKQNNRLTTFIHQETAELAKIAVRRGVARVIYDDTDQSYFGSFPWSDLREKLKYKLEEHGIVFEWIGERRRGKKNAGAARETATP